MKQFAVVLHRAAAVIVAAIVLNIYLGIVGFWYFHRVDNDPFETAVIINTIDGERIELIGGRRVRVAGVISEDLRKEIAESSNRVGLGQDAVGDSKVSLYVRREQTLCATGRELFLIPLIPCNVPKYCQKEFASGRIEERPAKSD